MSFAERKKDARPNQLSRLEDGFVEAFPSRDFRDGMGTFRFKLSHSALALVPCLAALIAASPALLHSAQKDKTAKPGAAANVFVPDKGKFRIVLDGNVVGSEEFEISPSGETWTARGSTSAHVPGGTDIKATGQLKLSPNGAPIRYDWSAQLEKKATGKVDFVDGTGKCSIDLGAASPILKDFKFTTPLIAVLDNNLYYQYDVLAQMYDWKAGGKQTFPVIIPQDMVPGSITVESAGPQQVDNATHEMLRVNSTDLEILLYVDANHRLVRLDVPSSKVVIQRE